MKKLTLLIVTLLLSLTTMQSTPLWMRYISISPDGKTIAFAYQGNIFLVPTSGGEAEKIISTEAHEYMPVWSHDSKTIAFAANTHGNFDVYIQSIDGGNPVRLTTNSRDELPLCFSPDNKQVYFSAYIQKPAESVQFPSG